MSLTVESQGVEGLEDLNVFGPLDVLPFSLDDPRYFDFIMHTVSGTSVTGFGGSASARNNSGGDDWSAVPRPNATDWTLQG